MTCTVPQNPYTVPAQFYSVVWQSYLALWSLPWTFCLHSANLSNQSQRGNTSTAD